MQKRLRSHVALEKAILTNNLIKVFSIVGPLLRGWLVAEESLLKESEDKLNNILTSKQLRNPLTLEIRRQYSTDKVLTRFNVILEPPTG